MRRLASVPLQWSVWVSGVLLATACSGRDRAEQRESAPRAEHADEPVGYPPGPWWRVASDLNDVVVSAQYILVAHAESKDPDMAQYARWEPQVRSRDDALQRALDLARQLRRDPESFAELARLNSDDLVTAPLGGMLGVFRANRVRTELFNALASIREGEVSRVFESPLGYHVLRRLKVPPEQRLAARQIVVKHRESIGRVAPGRSRDRTRAQALVLARRVAAQAAAQPERFSVLVAEHSDSYDAVQGGDVGAYATYEFSADPLMLHAVSKLAVGAVSGVVDSPLGYAIYQRTDRTERSILAASQIVVGHEQTPEAWWIDGRRPPRTPAQAEAVAVDLLSRLVRNPADFDRLRDAHCDVAACRASQWWSQGRANPDVDRAIAVIAIGALAPRLVRSELGFHILRRDDPAAAVDPAGDPRRRAARLDIPLPAAIPLTEVVQQLDAKQLQAYTRALQRDVLSQAALSEAEASTVSAILESMSLRFAQEPRSSWAELIGTSRREIRAALGPEKAARFDALVDSWYNAAALGG